MGPETFCGLGFFGWVGFLGGVHIFGDIDDFKECLINEHQLSA